ncbi:hypothetical protein [Sphingobacterium sp. SGL-16]|uniref:hypothetical protein n=1 Tax=Sphingobacterium sp. SGL-16 TaxID=2710883 RepID=UPI0013ECE163|nr:hypothetical protein [Sphingobacterium sp. SGL-16]NGM71651.1 hypothetical protein [Sphingobacterium sp. SGL-16]
MVFKQWDRSKFTPTKGFLSLNPNYWLTWGLHPNYPRTDHRPLSVAGPQSQRLLLVAAMKNTEEAYKSQTDTLRNVALREYTAYTGMLSEIDPLWQLYYQNEFRLLLNNIDPLEETSSTVRDYLSKIGLLSWYSEERDILRQRLQLARTTNMDRGARILSYHHILQDYRQLDTSWDTKKQRAELYLKIKLVSSTSKGAAWSFAPSAHKNDRQIADDILRKSKL